MEITLKDLLEDDNVRASLCDCLAEKIVNHINKETEEEYDDYGNVSGVLEVLKDDIENSVRGVAREVAVQETTKMLKDDYEIKRTIRECCKNYIVQQFNEMTTEV